MEERAESEIDPVSDRAGLLLKVVLPCCAVAAVSLLLTFGAWQNSRSQELEGELTRFHGSVGRSVVALVNRLVHYEAALRGLAGLFAGRETVTGAEWERCLERVAVERNYPAFACVMYLIDGGDGPPAPVHYRSVGGAPPFETMAPVKADGLRQALQYARDTDMLAISPPEPRLASPEGAPALFLCLPVYRPQARSFTVEDRRRDVQGWIVGVLDIRRLLNDTIGPSGEYLALTILDAEVPGVDGVILRDGEPAADRPRFHRELPIDFGGRTWQLEFRALPGFFSQESAGSSTAILTGGVIITVLLFLLLLSVGTTRYRALQLAQTMTRALSENRERLHAALAASDIGTWRWDGATDRITLDAGHSSLLGLTCGTVTMPREELLRYISPDDREMVREAFDEAAAHDACYRAEYRIVRVDGMTRWLRDKGNPLPAGDGLRMTGGVVDITERRQAEEALQARSRELHDFNRAMVDRETRVIELKEEVNALAATLGRTPPYPPVWEAADTAADTLDDTAADTLDDTAADTVAATLDAMAAEKPEGYRS